MKNAFTLLIAFPSLPSTIGAGVGGSVDWIGAFLGVAGPILFNFAFKCVLLLKDFHPFEIFQQSTFSMLWISICYCTFDHWHRLVLHIFAFWEIKVAKYPILPFDIWRAPMISAVILSAFLSFMSFRIFIYCKFIILSFNFNINWDR